MKTFSKQKPKVFLQILQDWFDSVVLIRKLKVFFHFPREWKKLFYVEQSKVHRLVYCPECWEHVQYRIISHRNIVQRMYCPRCWLYLGLIGVHPTIKVPEGTIFVEDERPV
jgi:predicted RNA-binding Zn-ribbon protein involved in translation (DUF1610 family)